MANTTFSGPVRSENGFEVISKNATTGVVQDRTQDFGLHDARRYYLCEPFYQRPAINADIDQAYTVEVARAANRNFEALGTNMTTALATFATTSAGILLTTAGARALQTSLAGS